MASATPDRRPRTFSETLRARTDDQLVDLLVQRPDLATPAPTSLLSLVARASSRAALERALGRLTALEIAVVEALLVLDPAPGPTTAEDVLSALGTETGAVERADDAEQTEDADRTDDAERVRAAIDRLLVAGLAWDTGPADEPDPPAQTAAPGTQTSPAPPTSADAPPTTPDPATHLRPSPGLLDVLGPYPAGLGPAAPAGTEVPAVADLLADAPPGAARILDALTWGPPVGIAPRADETARGATAWLVERRLLARSDDRHVVLPREVGLALRHGRTHRGVRTTPPVPEVRPLPPGVPDAEAAHAGLELVRLVARLGSAWQESPPPVLRSGGLGVRDLRRLANTLETDESTTVVVVEIAAAAGLVVDDGDDPPSFTATLLAEDWATGELGDRWAVLARAWWRSRRTPWSVGSRDERGALRAALDPDLWRPWVPRLRASVVGVLAQSPDAPLGVADVMDVLRWRAPRAVPPEQAVAGLLREAAVVGITGAGALSTPGRAVADADRPPGDRGPTDARADVAAAFESVLPAEVDDLLLQGDLTGIVPGRPSRALEQLVESAADVESRGAATTVRFSADSVVRALDHGRTADELLATLATHARTPVPQPLEYLIRDAARRHGQLRVGGASSYVRAQDPALLAGLVDVPALRRLGLVLLAPTVLAAQATPAEVQAALRDHGLVSVVEGPDGRLVAARSRRARSPGPGHRARRRGGLPEPVALDGPPDGTGPGPRARLAALVSRLRDHADHADHVELADGAEQVDPAERVERTDPAERADPTEHVDPADRTGRTHRAPGEDGGATHAASSGTGAPAPHRAPTPRGTTDPLSSLGLLREAIADGDMVWLEVVGPDGAPMRRFVRPMTLDAGRLRAQDPARDAELTVAVHRIASVARTNSAERR